MIAAFVILAMIALFGIGTGSTYATRRRAERAHRAILESWVVTRAGNVDWVTSARMAASLDRR